MSSTKVTMLSSKKTILGLSKSIPFYVSPRLSTAYERAEGVENINAANMQGSDAVAEGSSDDGRMKREDMREIKQEDMAMSNDAAKDGPIKGVEGADMVRDTAKRSPWMELG
ncbi:hypothetical protein VNO78_13589 [Psophocarpus tetragonolobus]|uniref:Uncharacterized protein n=1 Tax=Psophocarpus tetragonolobus TaxID=3891 RepID=A0AAN9SP98_PSOTE